MDRPESTSFELRSHTVSLNPHRAGASTSEHTATPRGKQTPTASFSLWTMVLAIVVLSSVASDLRGKNWAKLC